jgi:PAS domain S-box-containing protein
MAALIRGERVDEPAARVADPVRAPERFADLIDDLDAVVWEYEAASGRYTYVSAAVERIIGYPPERLLEEPGFWSALCHPDDLQFATDYYERLEREGGHGRLEYRVISADGREAWIRDVVHVVDPEGGGPRVVRGLCLEVTERKRAELRLAETERRYRSLIEQIPAVTYVWDSAGLASDNPETYVSPQIESMLGFAPHEWLVDTDLWRSRVHPEDVDRVMAESDRCDETGDPFKIEYRIRARDGRVLWLRDEAHVVARDAGGSPRLWQGVMFDISERRRTEKERQELLVRLVQAQEEERGRIGGDIHDDSVQKMTAVGMRIEALRRRVDDAEIQGGLDELDRTVRLAIERLRHLLFELRPPSLDREGLATTLRQYLEQSAPELGLRSRLVNDLHEEPPIEVRTIAYRITQEALANVRKHANASSVEVVLEGGSGGFVTRIRDDGSGFDPSDVRIDQLNHRGLETMRERAELAGGWLRIDSAKRNGNGRADLDGGNAGAGREVVGDPPPRGTTVEFWLPFQGWSRGWFDVA